MFCEVFSVFACVAVVGVQVFEIEFHAGAPGISPTEGGD